MTETSQPKPPEQAKGASRGLRIALAVSVALNLLVVGLAAGAVLRHGPGERMIRDLDFGPFGEAFSREDREAMRQGFLARAGDVEDMRDALRRDADELLDALRAEPFDPARVGAALEGQGRRMAERLELGRSLVLERIAAMSAAERAAFADRLEDAMRNHRRGPGS